MIYRLILVDRALINCSLSGVVVLFDLYLLLITFHSCIANFGLDKILFGAVLLASNYGLF